jgi:hypothetical protein
MRRAIFFFFLTSLIATFVYLLCIGPSVSWEDSGEFITTSRNLGISHPPGHPLYITLSHLFTYSKDLSSLALSVNCFSVLCSMFTLFLFSIFLYLYTEKPLSTDTFPIIIGVTFIFAFSTTFWYFSEIAEVYTLHTLLTLVLFISLLLFQRVHRRYLFLFSYVFGLSISNNVTILYLLPGFLLFLVLERKRITIPMVFISISLFLVGISFYIFIPIRSRFAPVFNWGNAQTLQNFLSLVLAREFSKGFFTLKYLETSLIPFLLNLLRELSYWGVIPSLFGFFSLFKKNRKLFILFLSSIICNVVFSFYSGRGPDFYAYFLPTILLFFITIFIGLKFLFSYIKGKKVLIYVSVFCVLSLVPLFLNYHKNCRKNDYDALYYGQTLLRWIPQNSVLLTENTNDFFILTYLLDIDKKRDIAVLYLPLFRTQWYPDFLTSQGYKWKGDLTPLSFSKDTNKPCFYSPGAGLSIPVDNIVPHGPIFTLTTKVEEISENKFSLPEPRSERGKRRYAILHSRFGEFYFKREEYWHSISAFEIAKEYDEKNPAIYHNLSVLYRYVNDLEKSSHYEKLAEIHGFHR